MSRDVSKLPREKGYKWRHNHRKYRNKETCPIPVSTGGKRTTSALIKSQVLAWSEWSQNLSLKAEKILSFWVFCHNIPKCVVFSKIQLCSLRTQLLRLDFSPRATLFHIIFRGSLSLRLSVMATLCGANWSLWALLVNVTLCSWSTGWQKLLVSAKAGTGKARRLSGWFCGIHQYDICYPLLPFTENGRECLSNRTQEWQTTQVKEHLNESIECWRKLGLWSQIPSGSGSQALAKGTKHPEFPFTLSFMK